MTMTTRMTGRPQTCNQVKWCMGRHFGPRMAGHLVAPRPVRLGTSAHIPFFLQGIPSTSPAPNPPALSESLDPSSQSAHEGQRPSPRPASRSPGNSNEFTTRDGRSIEELAASIRLDDEPQPSVSVSVPVPAAVPAPVRGPAVETLTNRSTCRWNAEDAFISPVPPRYVYVRTHRGV